MRRSWLPALLALSLVGCESHSEPGLSLDPNTGAVRASGPVGDVEYVLRPGGALVPAHRGPHSFKRVGKADFYDDFRAAAPQHYAITESPVGIGSLRPMVEWEPMQAIMMSYPGGMSGDVGATGTVVDIAYHTMMNPAAGGAEVWILTDSQGAANTLTDAIAERGVDTATLDSKLRLAIKPPSMGETFTIWFIDSGPLPVVDTSTDTFAFADFRYYNGRPNDDAFPTYVGRRLGSHFGLTSPVATYRVPLTTEGGTFQSTTDGVCLTGSRQLYYMSCHDLPDTDTNGDGVDDSCDSSLLTAPLDQLQDHAYTLEMESLVGPYAGCQDVVVTYSITDDGTGHLDMYLKIVDDQTLLVGEYLSPYQSGTGQATNATLMDLNAEFLAAYVKPDGSTFGVSRMVMPGHRNSSGGAIPFTYINSTFINGLNLWPASAYSAWTSKRNLAESQWEAAMPTTTHVWIDSDELSFWSGAIHCITRTIPAKDPGLWVGDGSCAGGTCSAPANGYDGACSPSGISEEVCWGPEWLCGCNDCEVTCPDGGSSDGGCGTVTYEGCCDGSVLSYCDGGALNQGTCAGGCGWDAGGGYYNCGHSGADPSGTYPISCEPEVCTPSCGALDCGDDGCGGECGVCEDGYDCEGGFCVAEPIPCGDVTVVGCCDGNVATYCEDDALIELNCVSCGWNTEAGYYECGQTGADPSGAHPLSCEPEVCTPTCAGVDCGDDGCGGECGPCEDGYDCEDGLCVTDAAGCGSVTWEGCCDGDTATWCADGVLGTKACPDGCGWTPTYGYWCGGSGADPSGDLPLSCNGDTPDPCAGAPCGAGGACEVSGDAFSCSCDGGYTGGGLGSPCTFAPTIAYVMDMVYCVVGLASCNAFTSDGAEPGWQLTISDVMNTIYCLVGSGPCEPPS